MTIVGTELGLEFGFEDGEDGWGESFDRSTETMEYSSLHMAVTSMVANAPPAEPEQGDRYVVGVDSTGAWADKDFHVALYSRGAWRFYPPRYGHRVYNLADSKFYEYRDTDEWVIDEAAADADRAEAARDEAEAVAATMAAIGPRLDLLEFFEDLTYAAQWGVSEVIGSAAPVTGTALAGNVTYVLGEAAPYNALLGRVRAFALAAGTVKVRRFTKSGDTFTQVVGSADVNVTLAVGLNTIILPDPVVVLAGEYLGFYNPTGVLSFKAGAADTGGWRSYAGDVTTFTQATVLNVSPPQIGFDLYTPLTTAARMTTAEAISTGLRADLGTLPADDEGTAFARIARLRALFVEPTSLNIYPFYSEGAFDALGQQPSAPANYNSGGGAGTTLATWAISGLLEGVSGNAYALSILSAPAGWWIHNAFVYYANADNSFHSANNTGATYANGNRTVAITMPAGAEKWGVNFRFAGGTPTQADVDALFAAIMLSEGAAPLPYEPPVPAGGALIPGPAFNGGGAAAPSSGSITLINVGQYTYIRQPKHLSPTKHIVRCLNTGEVASYNNAGRYALTGLVDTVGIRTIPASTPVANTVAAYAASTQIDRQGGDERPPLRLNGHYGGGGGHTIDCQLGYKVGHGLTAADVGKVGTDGGTPGKAYVLFYVIDANYVLWVPDNTGTTDGKWTLTNSTPTGTTLTISGGIGASTGWTFPSTAATPSIVRAVSKTVLADGVPAVGDGTWEGLNVASIEQSYEVCDQAEILTYLKANVGSSAYTHASIPTQLTRLMVQTFDDLGACRVVESELPNRPYRRNAGDYSGIMQFHRPTKTGDTPAGQSTAIKLYLPDVSPVGGYDYQAIADITAQTGFIDVPRLSCANPADPLSHGAIFGRNAGGVLQSAYLFGYSRVHGETIPTKRALMSSVHKYSASTGKQYPVAYDSGIGDAVAGVPYFTVGYDAYFDETDAALIVPAVGFEDIDGNWYCVVAAPGALAARWVEVPEKYKGRAASFAKSHANVFLHSQQAMAAPGKAAALLMRWTGYGDVVVRLAAV